MCSNAENTADDSNNLLEKFEKRFLNSSDNGIDFDCEFLVGTQQVVVKAHKFVFAVASNVFRAMFYGELREEKTVLVEDLHPEGFECMKQFFYTGEIKFSSAIQALLTYVAARKYLIPVLEKVCCRYIEEKTHPSEVLEFYECCKVFKVSEFEELCSKIIRENTDEVVVSDYLTTAKLETIELILSSSSLKLKSEIEVFDIFERWALAEAARNAIAVELMAPSFETLKKHIRFLTMSGDQFVSRVAESSLLTQEEKNIIAMNKIKLNAKPMPESLSPEQEKRHFITTLLETPECYSHSHTFVFNAIDGIVCGSCNEYTISTHSLYLHITARNDRRYKWVYLEVVPEFCKDSLDCLFIIKTKLSVFDAVMDVDDGLVENKCYFKADMLRKGEDQKVTIAAIAIEKLENLSLYQYQSPPTILLIQGSFNIEEVE